MADNQAACGPGCGHEHDPLDDWNIEEMDPCCQKEVLDRIKNGHYMRKLRAADVTQAAWAARTAVTANTAPDSWVDLEDYEALKAARAAFGISSQPSVAYPQNQNQEDDSDDDMLDDDPALQALQEETVKRIQEAQQEMAIMNSYGYGVHREIHWQQLLQVVSSSPSLVCHYYDPGSPLSAALDLHLEQVARSHLGTRFIRAWIPLGSPLAALHGVHTLPAMGCFKGGAPVTAPAPVRHWGEGSGLATEAVDQWLWHTGTLVKEPLPLAAMSGGQAPPSSDAEEEGQEAFDCGQSGCRKPFRHYHYNQQGGVPDPAHRLL